MPHAKPVRMYRAPYNWRNPSLANLVTRCSRLEDGHSKLHKQMSFVLKISLAPNRYFLTFWLIMEASGL